MAKNESHIRWWKQLSHRKKLFEKELSKVSARVR